MSCGPTRRDSVPSRPESAKAPPCELLNLVRHSENITRCPRMADNDISYPYGFWRSSLNSAHFQSSSRSTGPGVQYYNSQSGTDGGLSHDYDASRHCLRFNEPADFNWHTWMQYDLIRAL